MNENEIREQTQSIINAYREISCRDAQSLSISDFLMLRNQAVNELDRGIKSCITAISSPMNSIGSNKYEVAEHNEPSSRTNVHTEGTSKNNKISNNTSLDIPKRKSNFEILQQIKDEWNS